MQEEVCINLIEAARIVNEYIGSDEFEKHLESCSSTSCEFANGVMFGAAMAMIQINVKAQKYIINVEENNNISEEYEVIGFEKECSNGNQD